MRSSPVTFNQKCGGALPLDPLTCLFRRPPKLRKPGFQNSPRLEIHFNFGGQRSALQLWRASQNFLVNCDRGGSMFEFDV